MKLIVDGEGALELFEAPPLFNNDLIEEFESNADLKINPDFTSQKVFDYTYLGRGSVKIEKEDLSDAQAFVTELAKGTNDFDFITEEYFENDIINKYDTKSKNKFRAYRGGRAGPPSGDRR